MSSLDPNNMEHAVFIQRLESLEASLLDRDPMMKEHLKHIHKAMIQHEEIVPLLTNEQIAIIVGAQQAHTNTSLVQEIVKGKSKAAINKKAASMTLGDL